MEWRPIFNNSCKNYGSYFKRWSWSLIIFFRNFEGSCWQSLLSKSFKRKFERNKIQIPSPRKWKLRKSYNWKWKWRTWRNISLNCSSERRLLHKWWVFFIKVVWKQQRWLTINFQITLDCIEWKMRVMWKQLCLFICIVHLSTIAQCMMENEALERRWVILLLNKWIIYNNFLFLKVTFWSKYGKRLAQDEWLENHIT